MSPAIASVAIDPTMGTGMYQKRTDSGPGDGRFDEVAYRTRGAMEKGREKKVNGDALGGAVRN